VRRNFEAERLGGFEIDDQLVFRRRLHRKVGRSFTFEDTIDVPSQALAREPGGGLIAAPDGFINNRRRAMMTLTERRRLPAIYGFRQFVTEGALISYGPDSADIVRRSGLIALVLVATDRLSWISACSRASAIEHQPMLEELLAAEELVIRVLDPALAQHLVGQVVGVLRIASPAINRVGSGGRPGSSVSIR
jgi:hypothetical protein